MAPRNQIQGMRELERLVRRLGQIPQRSVTKAARAGAKIALKDARAKAPVDTGDLKKGIIMKGERRVKLGKKVFDVTIDPAKNNVFVKTSADGTKRYYYPASQEYGFMTAGGGYIPGYRYMRKAIDDNARQIEEKVIEVAREDVDKVLRSR